jgi:hypothetical protein
MGIVNTWYESDHTLWMRDLMAKHPEWATEQQSGRALWWDLQLDASAQKDYAAAREAQKPYPYDVNFFGE